MSEKAKNKNRYVDEAGIRLAPAPLHGENVVSMPSVKQEFVITPQLHIDAPENEPDQKATVTTEHDFQPKKKDISKKWKRRRKSKNVWLGIVMFVVSATILLLFALDAAGVKMNNSKFALIPDELGAIGNVIDAFKVSLKAGWSSKAAASAWLQSVPSLILIVGLIAVFVNFIKAIVGMFGAIKPRRYLPSAIVYLAAVFSVVIIYLVGAPSLGVEKVDFMTDIIKGYQTSELFSVAVFGLGYFVVSVICSLISSEKYGYLK